MVKAEAYVVSRVRDLVDRFRYEEYVEYKKAVKKASRIVSSYTKGNHVFVLYSDNGRSSEKTAFTMPVYRNTHEQIRRYAKKYQDLCISFIKERKADTLDEIERTRMDIDVLIYYDILVNAKVKTKIHTLMKERDEVLSKLVNARNGADLDEDKAQSIIKLQDEYWELIQKVRAWEDKQRIDYYVETLPESTAVPTITRDHVDKVIAKKPKDAVKKESSNKNDIPAPVHNILKSFPFNKLPVQMKSKDECLSRSPSKPYYISKENLIKAIDADPELKEIFGPKYKTKSKEELCNIIFSFHKN